MGLFDIFFGKQQSSSADEKAPTERELQRCERLVSNKLSQNYDRQEALEVLARMGTARSAEILLKRFNWQMDPSITDQEEKQVALDGITAAGEAALDPIRAYCRRADSLTWALKALRIIVPLERLEEELLGLLDGFDTEYVRNAEPKVQLITSLQEFRSDEVRIATEPFLSDANEPVRFAAVHTVFAVGDEKSVPALVEALSEEESLRIKNRIALGISEKKFIIPDELREACGRSLPREFSLNGEGRVVGA